MMKFRLPLVLLTGKKYAHIIVSACECLNSLGIAKSPHRNTVSRVSTGTLDLPQDEIQKFLPPKAFHVLAAADGGQLRRIPVQQLQTADVAEPHLAERRASWIDQSIWNANHPRDFLRCACD